MREFGLALATADEVVLTDIYPASEDPIPGITVEALAAAINSGRAQQVRIVAGLEEVAPTLAELARPGDVVITLGAGSIGSVASHVVAELERRHASEGTR
jgi:UDP-N-acetylmuramate--alanine ligase